MDNYNAIYVDDVKTVQTANNTLDIENAIKSLTSLRNNILQNHPEYIESIADIDYTIACAAYRINNVQLFETTIQKHYYDDTRFKRLYQNYRDVEITNVWNDVVKKKASNLEKTFVRSLSVVILTGVCLSVILRK